MQIVNCQGDTELQDDLEYGWHRTTNNVPHINPKFMDTLGLNFETNSQEPEVFFNQLFDNRIFTIMAEETNNYAHQQIRRIMGGRDKIQQIEYYSYKRHARLGTWRDVNESAIKIFMAHVLIMSSVRKHALHNYWSTKTSLFRTYLSRNKFQDILWNLHVADTTNNPPPGMPSHNPLVKVRLLITMLAFKVKYKIFKNNTFFSISL